MPRFCPRPVLETLLLASALAISAAPAHALEIWSGRTYFFGKPDFADWTQAVNQDRITPRIWLTRKDTQGIFNIFLEPGYTSVSPTDTEWATGNAVNYAGLTFLPWTSWASANPPGTVGVNAVVHLITEDIYLDIRFESWSGGPGSGGGFSYLRAVPPVVPTDKATWGRIKSLYQ